MLERRRGQLGVVLGLCAFLLFFTLPVQAYTTEVHVAKYAPDGTTILNETTVNYTWMRDNLPVMDEANLNGTKYTHHYFQGPIFPGEWEKIHPNETWNYDEDRWNPEEDVNVYTRDYGAVAGTNVRDLCDLVGGMLPEDVVMIKASDNFSKYFPWDDVYNYDSQPKQGPMVLAWYNGEESITGEHQGVGYPDTGYFTGMRLHFFADNSTNPQGWHAFGDWDMHEYMEEEYWHYYYDSTEGLMPSSSGLSVKYISAILIYTAEIKPDLIVTAIDTPDEIYNGTSNIISATIENIGNKSTVEPFNVSLDDGSGVVDTTIVDIGGLGAGENITVKFLWTPAAPADYMLTVTADSDGVVDEWNETNNQTTEGITAIPIPQTDLVVTTVHDGDAFIDEPNVIFALIKNNGADAHSFNVSLELDGELKDTVFIPMLYLRETQLVALDWTPTTTGQKTVYVTVDCDGDVAESNETNNVTSQLVDVTSLTTVNVGDGESIQAAINAASSGTKILVAGTHNEQVVIPSAKSAIRLIANGTEAEIHTDNSGDIIKVETTDCWVQGLTIHSTWNKDDEDDDEDFANYPGAGINITANSWNVITDNYIYNSSSGVKLYSSCNLFRNNTIGDTEAGRDCRRLMIISGDCNEIVKNVFDGNTDRHNWVLGGVLNYAATKYRVDTYAPANGNLVRDNTFNVRGFFSPFVVFGGDQNLVFNNDINDTVTINVAPEKLNWYCVDKVAVDIPKTGNIVHGPFYGGNYWRGYTGTDSDQDLLGDTAVPYRGYDAHPLIQATCGDVNADSDVTVYDTTLLKLYIGAVPGWELGSEWASDVNGDGDITVYDTTLLKLYIGAVPGWELNCCGE
ncbi:MAG: hypothetical protein JW878_02500 [Methanomicrobia archaeon]|nr:hypothetical protein [Methanomicrobia archaeon]